MGSLRKKINLPANRDGKAGGVGGIVIDYGTKDPMMTLHGDWFSVDVKKRAAKVRGHKLGQVLKELVANSLDARATTIQLSCQEVPGTRRDQAGLKAFEVLCIDNGQGCTDPEILRRVGASTSDLHPGTRGRFGQGLVDVLAICKTANIQTLHHHLIFDENGCQISRLKRQVSGMRFEAVIRHGGDGFVDLGDYFNLFILPEGTMFRFNGRLVDIREPVRVVPGIELQTILYNPATDRVCRKNRKSEVQILPRRSASSMIYELGLPVDEVPWDLPYDINVLQKTPLDTDRDMLPDKYKKKLVSELINPLSDLYEAYMRERQKAPREVRDNPDNASRLTSGGRRELIRTVVKADPDRVVCRKPWNQDDRSESHELETLGYAPVNRASLPAGVSRIIKDAPTVAEVHDRVCKPQVQSDPDFPPETERQRTIMSVYAEIALNLLGREVRLERIQGDTVRAAWRDGVIMLNIDEASLWNDPLGEESLGIVLHECAHCMVSGHAKDFGDEVGRLGGRLAVWVGEHAERWAEFKAMALAHRT